MGKRAQQIAWGVVGVLVLAMIFQLCQFYQAAEQQHSTYQYQPAENSGFRLDAATKTPTPHYKPSCNNPNEREDADLCAQWAAVDQVSESNRLSAQNLRMSVFTLLLTILGTGALLFTLRETYRTTRAELRPYVSAYAKGLPGFEVGKKMCATMVITNGGTTLAHDVTTEGTLLIEESPLKADPLAGPIKYFGGDPGFHTLHKGATHGATVSAAEKLTKADFNAVWGGKKALYVIGNVDYRDSFGAPHRTEFCFFLTGEDLREGIQNAAIKTMNKSAQRPDVRWSLGNLHTKST
jgi:hypothetical protein